MNSTCPILILSCEFWNLDPCYIKRFLAYYCRLVDLLLIATCIYTLGNMLTLILVPSEPKFVIRYTFSCNIILQDGTIHDQQWPQIDEGFTPPVRFIVSVSKYNRFIII